MSESIEKVQFATNILAQVALAFDGPGLAAPSRRDGYSDQVLFTVLDADGVSKRMYVAPIAADYIKQLGLRKGEPFRIGKVEEKTTDHRRSVRWKVERIAQKPETALARDLRDSVAVANARKAGDNRTPAQIAKSIQEARPHEWPEAEAPRQPQKQTAATTPPVPSAGKTSIAPAPARPAQIPTKVPYNRAFNQIVKFMREGLREHNEQWTDQARQDFVSTALIAAQKEGWLTIWEQEPEEPTAKTTRGKVQ